MKRKCEYCEKAITGRSDQRFCSNACRNNFNNGLNRDSTKHIRNINNALRRNRRILEELKTRTTVKELIESGFNFEYFTSVKDERVFCYDISYSVSGENVKIN